MRRTLTVDALGYTAILALLGAAWLRHAAVAIPRDNHPADGWLILWVLEWCFQALGTSPSRLFDPPVNYPAPGQLAGSEHFLGAQLLFAPLRLLTGGPVLAANLTLFASYVLAGVAADAMLRAFGVSRAVAFVAGLLYALGPSAFPARPHVLQSQHVFYPLVMLTLHALRDHPTWKRAGLTFVVLLAGMLSSYHVAVYLAVVATVSGAAEMLRRAPGRGAFLLCAGTAGIAAATVVLVVSRPYFARPEAQGDEALVASAYRTDHLTGTSTVTTQSLGTLAGRVGACVLGAHSAITCPPSPVLATVSAIDGLGGPHLWMVPALALLGVAWIARPERRGLVLLALVFGVTGAVLATAGRVEIASFRFPLGGEMLSMTPARFIRVPGRALAISFVGTTILFALGLETLRRWLPPRLAAATVLLVAVLVPIGTRPPGPSGWAWSRFTPRQLEHAAALERDREVYAAVAVTVARAPGPLLEVPGKTDAGSVVVGQMLHRQPSISFYTGYQAQHTRLLSRLIPRLPDADALDDLVDMTTLRWILLRPASEWPNRRTRRRFLEAIERHARWRETFPLGAFTLVGLDSTSHRPQWFEALRAGLQPNRTVLGTPLAPLPVLPDPVLLVVDQVAPVQGNRAFIARVRMTNRTTAPWPAAPWPVDRAFGVVVETRWIPADGGGDSLPTSRGPLFRDVAGGETVVMDVLVPVPDRPGPHRLEVAIRQLEGTDLSSPSNPLRVDVAVPAPG